MGRPGGDRSLASEHRAHRFARQLLAHGGTGVDEGRARHMQAHGFEKHLVAVGGTVKGAGAGRVVGPGLGVQQLRPPHQAQRGLLAHLGFFVIRQARGHGAGRHKHGRQMTKMQRADQKAGHDLVAHAQHQRAIKHIVTQRDGGGHGNHVAREQAELHAGRALGHAVAHGGHAAGHLRRGAQAAGLGLDDVGVMLQRRVGRQHVIEGGHDANIGRALGHDTKLVIGWQRGESVRHIRTAQPLGTGFAIGGQRQTIQVGAARDPAAFTDACRDSLNG